MGWGCYCHWEDEAWPQLSSELDELPQNRRAPVGMGSQGLHRGGWAEHWGWRRRAPAASPRKPPKAPQMPGSEVGLLGPGSQRPSPTWPLCPLPSQYQTAPSSTPEPGGALLSPRWPQLLGHLCYQIMCFLCPKFKYHLCPLEAGCPSASPHSSLSPSTLIQSKGIKTAPRWFLSHKALEQQPAAISTT